MEYLYCKMITFKILQVVEFFMAEKEYQIFQFDCCLKYIAERCHI